jgi:integrase
LRVVGGGNEYGIGFPRTVPIPRPKRRRAKINPAVCFHTLRHTHGSTLAMRGVPMAVIAEQLGHMLGYDFRKGQVALR